MSFVSGVFAAAATVPASGVAGIGSSVAGLIPLLLIFCVFYFFIIRPQQRKIREHNKLLESVKKGDKVVVSSSILGSVTKVDSAAGHFLIEIAEGVEIKVLKSSISEVLNKSVKTGSVGEKSASAVNN